MSEKLTTEEREQLRSNITLTAMAMNPLTCRALLSLLDEVEELKASAFAMEHERREMADALKAAGLVSRRVGARLAVIGASGR